MLTVRRKYDVRETASDFERSDALAKLFDVREAASDSERSNALAKLSVDVKKTASDPERSDALAKLFDCQTAAFDRETVRCALAIVCGESPLQPAGCSVIRDEIGGAKIRC